MRQQRTLVVGCLVVAAVAGLVLAEPALAQTSDVGRNVGREVRTWGTALL